MFIFRFLYDLNMLLQFKIETIAKEMYGAKSVEFNENILNKLNTYESKVYYTYKISQIFSKPKIEIYIFPLEILQQALFKCIDFQKLNIKLLLRMKIITGSY